MVQKELSKRKISNISEKDEETYLTRKIELAQNELRRFEGFVDILVRPPYRMRPQLPTMNKLHNKLTNQ